MTIRRRWLFIIAVALWLGGVYWGADHAQDVMGPCSQQVRP